MAYPKVTPLFNYIGGKTWLRDKLRTEVQFILDHSSTITHYTEPFAGGLGAFLSIYDLLIDKKIKDITLNDINKKVINLYKQLNNKPKDLVLAYMKLEQGFIQTIPSSSYQRHKTKEKAILKMELVKANSYFNTLRTAFNTQQTDMDSAAHLLFLQNHCFNGVYRENSKGGYNTPFNWEAKTFTQAKIEEKVNALRTVFSYFNITFSEKSFQQLDYNLHTLYYLDPPYINTDISENKYNKAGFSAETQKELITKIAPTAFVYSNHDHTLLIDHFNQQERSFHIARISRKNIISASASSRQNDKIEILVRPTTA